MGHGSLSLVSPGEVVFKGVSFAEVTNYLPQGTLTLVCSADTSCISPLLLPGIRVRRIPKKITF
jgi:hypothetical protein